MIGAPCVVNGKMRNNYVAISGPCASTVCTPRGRDVRRTVSALGALELAAGYVTCKVVGLKPPKGQATLRPYRYPRGLPKILSSVNRGIAVEQIARMACPQRESHAYKCLRHPLP